MSFEKEFRKLINNHMNELSTDEEVYDTMVSLIEIGDDYRLVVNDEMKLYIDNVNNLLESLMVTYEVNTKLYPPELEETGFNG